MANTDLTNYLKTVRGTRINFNNAFSQDLTQVLDDIDDNFQRLISAPFLQGDKGDSVVRVTEDIYDNNGYLTDFGVAFVNSLYENVLTVDNTWNYQMIEDELSNNHPQTDVIESNGENLYSCELLGPNQNHIDSVDCYKIENDDKEIFVSLIHFHDIRVHYLVESMGPSYGTAFFDRTCTLYGTYDGANWDIRRYETVPTLYYDEQQGFFCWRINGAESGIIAQGVKGDKGDPSKIWVCKGRIFSNADDTTIQNNIYLFGVISCSIPDTILNIGNIRQDDIVYVWFDRDDNTTQPLPLNTPALWTASDFTVGTAQEQGQNKYIEYFADANLMLITSSFALRECLNRIGYDSVASPLPSTVRGLFMPNFGESFSNPQSPLSDDNVIMFYSVSNNNEELPFERLSASSSTHIGEVPYNFTYGMDLDNEHVSPLINSERIRLDLDYNEVLFLPKNKQNITKENDNTYSVHIKNYENNNELTTELRLNSNDSYKFISLHLPFEQYNLGDNRQASDSAGLNIGINLNKQVNIGSNTYKNNSQSNLPNRIFNGNGTIKHTYNYYSKLQDENVTLQVNHSRWENNDTGTLAYENYEINNIFNYGLNDILGLNLRHIQHVGISSQFDGRLGLVFNPRAEFVNYDGRDFIRLYTPSIAYVRDCTNPTALNRYTGDGVLGYCKYNSGTPNINSLFESTNDDKGTINELFLYDNIKLRVSSNRNCSFSGMGSYTNSTPHTSLINNLPKYDEYFGHPNQGFDCPINANINNDYFDVYIGNKNGKPPDNNNNQTDTLIIYNNIDDQNNGYFYGPYYESIKQNKIENYPLCTFEMEKDLKICEVSGQPVYLNRNLYLYGICFKQIENAINNNTKSIQFTYLFTPYWKSLDITNPHNVSFDFSMIKSNEGNDTFLNDDRTLALSMDANRNNLPYNFDFKIENEGNNQIINSSKLLKISFIVDFDSSKKRVIGVRPCGSADSNRNQIDYSIRNEIYDIFNWADVCYNWGYLHGNNLSGEQWESSLYLQPPVNWKLDNDNEIERTKNFNIEKGFIEAEIGDNLWSSKPRLRLSPYVSTENFVLWNNDTTKSPIVIRELQTNHEFRSYKLLNRNEYADEYGVNPNDLFVLTNKIDLSGRPSITKSNKKFFGDYYSNGSISQSLFGYGQNRVDDTSHTLMIINNQIQNQDIPIDLENQVFI